MSILHENKYDPAPIPRTKIVEAYGLLKCPKLVEQVAGEDLEVRNNALAVLSEEFRNPYLVQGCSANGIIPLLAGMVVDPDYNTRLLSSRALSIAALDANGLTAILEDSAVAPILEGMKDPSEVVRGNVYECLYNVSKTSLGIDACVAAKVTTAFVRSAKVETMSLKPVLLRTIYNLVSSEQGLTDALRASAVKICIDLIHCDNAETRTEAVKTLGFICYDESAKGEALDYDAVEKIVELLTESPRHGPSRRQPISVIAAATMALMAVTSTDEGKRRIFTCGEGSGRAAEHIAALLTVDNRIIKLNTLKVISNIVVYPPLRNLLIEGGVTIEHLTALRDSGDALMEKHARIALAAVNWRA